MRKIIPLAAVMTMAFLGCAQSTQRSYNEYLSHIPILSLPCTLDYSVNPVVPELDIDEDLLSLHKPEGAMILGRFETDTDYAVLIYLYPGDILWPVAATASSDNNRISEMSLLIDECWQFEADDPIGFCNCDIRIDEDLTIAVVRRFGDMAVVARYGIDENGVISETL